MCVWGICLSVHMFDCVCAHLSVSDSAAVCLRMMEDNLKFDRATKAATPPTQGDEDECVGYRVCADAKTQTNTHITDTIICSLEMLRLRKTPKQRK